VRIALIVAAEDVDSQQIGRASMRSNQLGRALLRGVRLVLILVLLPLATGVGVFNYKAHQIVADTRPALGAPLPPLQTPDPSRRIAVVLLSNSGTEITDALPPYELLAASGAFNTYVIAPERRAHDQRAGTAFWDWAAAGGPRRVRAEPAAQLHHDPRAQVRSLALRHAPGAALQLRRCTAIESYEGRSR